MNHNTKNRYKDFSDYKRKYDLDENLTSDEKNKLDSGMPFQKIIGYINFDNLKINVSRNVLIPRYETQELVEKALEYVNHNSRVLDLCTGSGYIGLTIKQKTNANVVMSDISKEAIYQSQENALINNLDVKIIHSDLFKNISTKFDLIISNPPYIPNNVKLDNSVTKFEPSIALYAGDDGNKVFKKIIDECQDYLNPNGILIFEMSVDNKNYLLGEGFEIIKDINNKPRIAIKKY